MKSIGIIKKIDSLGRVVIPVSYRKDLGFSEKSRVEVIACEEGLLLRKTPFSQPGKENKHTTAH